MVQAGRLYQIQSLSDTQFIMHSHILKKMELKVNMVLITLRLILFHPAAVLQNLTC